MIRPRGRRAERWAEWHKASRAAVRLRADVAPFMAYASVGDGGVMGRCESCGNRLPIDWAHLFGRGNVIAEPWCSLPELTVALCRRCHDEIDEERAPANRERLRWAALRRLAASFPQVDLAVVAGRTALAMAPGVDQRLVVDVARACERRLVETLDADDFVRTRIAASPARF